MASAVLGRPGPRGTPPGGLLRQEPFHFRREAQSRPAAELHGVVPGDAFDRQLRPTGGRGQLLAAEMGRIGLHHARPLLLGHLADADPKALHRHLAGGFLLPGGNLARLHPGQHQLRAAGQHDRPFFEWSLSRRQGAGALRRCGKGRRRHEERRQGREQPSARAFHHLPSSWASFSQCAMAFFSACLAGFSGGLRGSAHRRKPISPGAGQTAYG